MFIYSFLCPLNDKNYNLLISCGRFNHPFNQNYSQTAKRPTASVSIHDHSTLNTIYGVICEPDFLYSTK